MSLHHEIKHTQINSAENRQVRINQTSKNRNQGFTVPSKINSL